MICIFENELSEKNISDWIVQHLMRVFVYIPFLSIVDHFWAKWVAYSGSATQKLRKHLGEGSDLKVIRFSLSTMDSQYLLSVRLLKDLALTLSLLFSSTHYLNMSEKKTFIRDSVLLIYIKLPFTRELTQCNYFNFTETMYTLPFYSNKLHIISF